MNSATTPQPAEALPRAKHNATSKQIRGSSLMLVGRAISMGLNFLIQVLIVRYFANAKGDYGAFAYALSIVALVQSVSTFGLDRAVTRFLPIYHEREEYNKLFGTLVMVVGTILSLGVAIVLLVYSLQAQLLSWDWVRDPQALSLMLVLIFLAPVQAIDQLFEGLFAVFSSTKAIFFRKYILAPGLKLAVVGLLMLGQSDIYFLASGYLAAGAFGVLLYGFMLFNTLRKQGLFKYLNLRTLDIPWREVLAFTVPLLTSDLVYILMNTSDAILLERFSGTAEVAAFRAVQPAAGMNQLVMTSFQLLFTPLAARMFARNDREGINNLYWQTAIWISVMAFPLFALSFTMAGPLTVMLYTEEYASSAIILALLSLGYYFSAALGFNGLTLKVFGKVRYIVVVNIAAALVNLGLNLFLIPRYGALGAAIGTCSTMIAHNIFKQLGLLFGTGISIFEWRHLKVYAVIIVATISLLLFQQLFLPNFYVGFAAATVVSLVVLALTRKSLAIGQTFPELLRFPLMRRIFGE
jgi:O-antigen/teichoic acid export membrane protein